MLISGCIILFLGILTMTFSSLIGGEKIFLHIIYSEILNKPVMLSDMWFIAGIIISGLGVTLIIAGVIRKKNGFASIQSQKINCPSCFSVLDKSDLFCKKCGLRQAEYTPENSHLLCTKCACPFEASYLYCPRCGTKNVNICKQNTGHRYSAAFILMLLSICIAPVMADVFGLIWTFMDVDYPMFDVNSLPTSIEWTYTNGILTSVTDMIYENILFACISCVIVLFMEKYGIINHKVFKKRNMIIPFCIYALSYFGSPGIIFQFFGNTITYAYSNSSAMASITDISHIFYWMSMILYMMIKSGKLRMTMQKTLIFAGFSILYYIVTALIMQSYCVEIFGYDDEIAELIDIFMPLHFASNFMFCMYIFTIAILNGKNLMGCIGNIISVAVFITVHIFVSVFSIAFGHSAIKMVGAIRLLPFIITICSMIIIALINNRKNNEFIK